jgi:hypothetical protein
MNKINNVEKLGYDNLKLLLQEIADKNKMEFSEL